MNENGRVRALKKGGFNTLFSYLFDSDAELPITVNKEMFLDRYTFGIQNSNRGFGLLPFYKTNKAVYTEKFRNDTDEYKKTLDAIYKQEFGLFKYWHGNCFGLSSMSMLFANGDEDISLYHGWFGKPVQKVSALKPRNYRLSDGNKKSVINIIESSQALQYSKDFQRMFSIMATDGVTTYSKERFEEIKKRLDEDKCVLIEMTFRDCKTEAQILGHAVLAYDMKVLEDKYILYIYDSNFPQKIMWIECMNEDVYGGSYTKTKASHPIKICDENGEIPEYKNALKEHYREKQDSDGNSEKEFEGEDFITLFLYNYETIKKINSQNDNIPSNSRVSSGCSLPAGTTITNADGASITVDELDPEGKNAIGAACLNYDILTADGIQKPAYYDIVLPAGSYTVTPAEDMPLDIIIAENDRNINLTADEGSTASFVVPEQAQGISDGSISVRNEENAAGFTVTEMSDALQAQGVDVISTTGTFAGNCVYDGKARTFKNVADVAVTAQTSELLASVETASEVNYSAVSLAVENGKISASTKGDDGENSYTLIAPERRKLDAPTASQKTGSYDEALNIQLTNELGGSIYYTLDGSTPTTQSNLYHGEICLGKSAEIKAIAVKDGFITSDVASYSYTFSKPSMPTASVPAGSLTKTAYCELTTEEENAEIYYTLDGRDPVLYGVPYAIPIVLCRNRTVKAVTVKNGLYSDVFTAEYEVNPNGYVVINAVTDQTNRTVTRDSLKNVTELNFVMYAPKMVGMTNSLYLCEYDENGKLLAVQKEDIKVTEADDTVTVPWTCVSSETAAVKGYIWSDTLAPLSDVIEVFN